MGLFVAWVGDRYLIGRGRPLAMQNLNIYGCRYMRAKKRLGAELTLHSSACCLSSPVRVTTGRKKTACDPQLIRCQLRAKRAVETKKSRGVGQKPIYKQHQSEQVDRLVEVHPTNGCRMLDPKIAPRPGQRNTPSLCQKKQAFQPWEPLSHNTQMGSDFRHFVPSKSLRISKSVYT